ncbi:putative quorum-sensing-regulated virulence factor [Xenorhabdus sp. Sc-CR9]|nr:DUF3820 family protein [Xenorhabdus sp. Sc-CR9]
MKKENLLEIANTVMPFGKYKGHMQTLPIGVREWVVNTHLMKRMTTKE